MRRAHGLQIGASYITGGRGSAGAGLTDLRVLGLRYELPFAGMFRAMFGLGYGRGERYVIDPAAPPESRRLGPDQDDAILAGGELQLLITGQKTWHNLAPYVTVGGGLAYGGAEPDREAVGYKFGTKTYLTTGAGVRWYPARRFSLRADFCLFLWRLRYPPQYYVSIQDQPPVLAPEVEENEWTRHPSLRLAVGWTF
jgi:hypothetical protein